MADNVSPSYRPGALADSYAVFEVFWHALQDLSRRMGGEAVSGDEDAASLASGWQRRRSLFEHMARTAELFWVAEQAGEVVGYARSILRDGVRELTELFVMPGQQSAGVGRELLARAFPGEGARNRVIIASPDTRALARYMKAGTTARQANKYFEGPAVASHVESDLDFEPITGSAAEMAALHALDKSLLGHGRDEDHAWLARDRHGFLYRRRGEAVGYGYVGRGGGGPFALVEASDFPAVLAHAETKAAGLGSRFGVETPLANQAAVRYLLERGYRMEAFTTYLMSDHPFGRFENYIYTSPPLFL